MINFRTLTLTALTLAVLAGCNTPAGTNVALDQARSDYSVAEGSPAVAQLAAVELKQASDALERANEAARKSADPSEINHLAYIARQRVAIARELANQRGSDAELSQARSRRDQIRLRARTDEADMAQKQAEAAQQQASAATLQAATSLQLSQDAQARNRELEAQLKDLNARQTARGLVITIGDVLFDTDAASLKARGVRDLEKLSNFLAQHPDRRLLIEGFTDSTGTTEHNQLLSRRRADAVMAVLVQSGVARTRIDTHAYGEAYPVSGNGDAQGRSLNRRVEIVLSGEDGRIAPR
ncbi:MAG TPA: OmpA family protein [Aquabacterium sp.]|uniref:OmpA family protein n=1 Tax=Aquabacterium sp. TaxID=1872578 RepID=UPI002E2FA72F|nr:OmpA family protein [Aquabacterium sp.]HEX5357155.1 OmpA family protein [Aquabacterium sp.]